MHLIKKLGLSIALFLMPVQAIVAQHNNHKSHTNSWYSLRAVVSCASSALGLGWIGFSLYDSKMNNKPLEWKSIVAGSGAVVAGVALYPKQKKESKLNDLSSIQRARLRDATFLAKKMSPEREAQLAREFAFLRDKKAERMELDGSYGKSKLTIGACASAMQVKSHATPPAQQSPKKADAPHAADNDSCETLVPQSVAQQTVQAALCSDNREQERGPRLNFMKAANEHGMNVQVDGAIRFTFDVLPDGIVRFDVESEKAREFLKQERANKQRKMSAQDKLQSVKDKLNVGAASAATRALSPRKPPTYAATLPERLTFRGGSLSKPLLAILAADNGPSRDAITDDLIQLDQDIQNLSIDDDKPKITDIVDRICALHKTHAVPVGWLFEAIKTKAFEIGKFFTTDLISGTKERRITKHKKWMHANFENEFPVNAYKKFIPLVREGIIQPEELIVLCRFFGAQIDSTKEQMILQRIKADAQRPPTPKK